MPEAHFSRQLARHVRRASWNDFDEATIAAGKTSLLDLFGVMLAATGLEDCVRPFLDLTEEAGGAPTCTIIGRSFRAPMLTAAFANGALSHAIDFDDGHDTAAVHPTAVCVPPLMAVAERQGSSGRDFLEALIIGSDITCRLGLALTKGIDQFGWYPPPILGAFGAVAACGRLLDLSEDQLIDAFSLVLSQATASAEILFSPRSDIRSVRDAFASQAVLNAALLAQRGIKGFDAPFEGRAGFINSFARGHFDEAVFFEDLGVRYENRNLGYKLWPSCRGTHGYVQIALDLIERHAITPDQIAAIRLSGHDFGLKLMEPAEQKLHPQNSVGAKFSLPFTMGTVFVRGRALIEDFFVDRLEDSEVLALAGLTSFHPLEPAPRSLTAARMTVVLKDGREVSGEADFAFGHPSNPIPREQLIGKFHLCADYAEVPPDQARQQTIVSGVWRIEGQERVADLLGLLAR